VAAEQALAIRVAGHHLDRRVDAKSAVAAIGLQEYPPGVMVGIWRGREQADVLHMEVDWLADPVDIAEEAAAIASLRDCADVRVG
jgi:hypothetical protein